ncbi:hypothetical protein BV898_13120 [Hypsibius exemplaris]|uniref:Uncharacterized protein n=1 Tax=Hypsibius exemplaris TaxID=2072580 RepID=A0A1W0WBS4_HYPEX|nr:hypothetical protein BV898_13120 [Hypsibius exemplaris]
MLMTIPSHGRVSCGALRVQSRNLCRYDYRGKCPMPVSHFNRKTERPLFSRMVNSNPRGSFTWTIVHPVNTDAERTSTSYFTAACSGTRAHSAAMAEDHVPASSKMGWSEFEPFWPMRAAVFDHS